MIHLPFDLEYWLITVFAGNADLFFFMFLFGFFALSAYFKLNGALVGVSMILLATTFRYIGIAEPLFLGSVIIGTVIIVAVLIRMIFK